jgi:propanol-preferring alcohol dehydrogenase
MKAMILDRARPLKEVPSPLRLVDLPIPNPGPEEVLIRVSVCGVCHTELDEIEGRLTPRYLPIVLGHEIVGRVEKCGSEATNPTVGDRIGVGWIHHSDGQETENLSPQFRATGCDVNGGYAEYMTVPARYAIPIPEGFSDEQAAPLLCAGAIGYRALRLTDIQDGDPLGLMGFGGSAHLVLQTAKHLFPNTPVFVFARESSVREFAIRLGADWAGDVGQSPPQRPRSVIDTTPAWRPVVESLKLLQPGGRLVINAIRKESSDKDALLELSYHEHLWMEREIKSVANLTRRDIADFLPLAAEIPIQPEVAVFPLEQANEALRNLRRGSIRGANVLKIS